MNVENHNLTADRARSGQFGADAHQHSDMEAHGVMRDVRNLFGAALVGGVAVAILSQMAQSLLGPAIGMAAAASFASALSSASHGRLVHQHSIPFLAVFVVLGTPVVYGAMWIIHRGMALLGMA